MRGLIVAAVAVAALGGSAAPASAGGWWSFLDVPGDHLVAGETISVRSEAFFTTTERAERAQQRSWHAYLVRGYNQAWLDEAMTRNDPKDWWALDDDARLVHVGRVSLRNFDGNVGDARAEVTVPPDLRGRWHLMFCDRGCATPLGYVIPRPIRITTDALGVQNARELDSLEERGTRIVGELREALAQAQRDSAEATAVARDGRRVLGGMEAEIRLLKAQAQREPSLPWAHLAAALLLGLVGGLVGARIFALRARAHGGDPPGADDALWEPPARLVESGRR